jgi:hypothetical protein
MVAIKDASKVATLKEMIKDVSPQVPEYRDSHQPCLSTLVHESQISCTSS